MTKNQKISAAILAHKAAGKSINEAFDAVLGDGAFLKFAGELYDELRRKSANTVKDSRCYLTVRAW